MSGVRLPSPPPVNEAPESHSGSGVFLSRALGPSLVAHLEVRLARNERDVLPLVDHVADGVARELGLTGWVRNEPDGSVRAEIQGSAAHVGAFFSRMLDAYRRHPISYVVDEREDVALVPGETDFEVRY